MVWKLSVLFLIAGTVAALAIDVAVISLEQDDGVRSGHTLALPQKECEALLVKTADHQKAGTKFRITLRNPDFTGTVLNMGCIAPDGSERPKPK